MKLKSQNKSKKIIVISIIAVAVIAILVLVGASITNEVIEEQKQVIDRIEMSITPKTEYRVDQPFDPSGLEIQVIAGANDYSYYVKYPDLDLQFSGFDSSKAVDEQVITVKYKEFTTTFTITILPKLEVPATKELVSIRLTDNLIKEYSKNDWNFFGPTLDNVFIIPIFSDGTEGDPVAISINDFDDLNLNIQSAGEYDFVVSYTYGGKTVKTTVTITITE